MLLAFICGLVCVFALRANNEHMIQLRNDVYQADKNNGNVEQALENLRAFMYNHMNTALASGPNAVHPPIQLKYMYDRLVTANEQQAQATNAHVYTDAQAYCQATIPTGFSGRYRLSCIDSYVSSHGVKAQTIPRNLYEFDFVDAKWSPDLAGWTMVIGVLLVMLALGTWISDRVIRRRLAKHE